MIVSSLFFLAINIVLSCLKGFLIFLILKGSLLWILFENELDMEFVNLDPKDFYAFIKGLF